jgi:hypothetical protein
MLVTGREQPEILKTPAMAYLHVKMLDRVEVLEVF